VAGQLPDLSIILCSLNWNDLDGAVDGIQFAYVCSLQSYLILGFSLMVMDAKEVFYFV
jgi:hypothetical protein